MSVCSRLGPTPDFRWTIRNDRTFRASIRRILEREFDRVIPGHGSIVEYLLPYVESWQEAGVAPDTDPEVVVGTLRAVTFVTLHRNELGPKYPAIRGTLIERLAAGLVP